MLRISYETEGFPPGTIPTGRSELSITWDDVLWAAITVGRPNRYYVFRHGASSRYEALFRWSLIRMALEQSNPVGSRLRRTNAAKTLDPTEKGAVNYFLGMTFCKLFAWRLLNTPWLLHLDVFRPQLNPLLIGRSRPDLVGMEFGANRWHSFECKGRISPPGSEVKAKAKTQARRLVSVNATVCTLHVGAITYFQNDVLHFYWCDPAPEKKNTVDISFIGDAWRHYYSPIMEIMKPVELRSFVASTGASLKVEGVDIEVGVHPAITDFLLNKKWENAQRAVAEAKTEIAEAVYQPDGLMVKAGESWHKRFTELDSKD